MDAVLVKTFQAVVATESFVTAAERIHVTQSTVSQRIQKLEQILGQRLFDRSKSGVNLTPSGAKFEPYARAFTQLVDEAVYQTSLPEEYTGYLSLGCEESLWPELSASWLSRLAETLPNTAFRFQVGGRANLSSLLSRGRIDIAVQFMPVVRPGFHVEHIMDDKLVLVSALENHSGTIGEDYIYADWGTEFAMAHSRWFPSLKPSRQVVQLGPAIARYLIDNRKTAFLPYRVADDYIASGELHFVRAGPEFPYPSYAVWTENKPPELMNAALAELRRAARNAPLIKLNK